MRSDWSSAWGRIGLGCDHTGIVRLNKEFHSVAVISWRLHKALSDPAGLRASTQGSIASLPE
jgi:hypothetical protein